MLTSETNPKLKAIRRLRQCKGEHQGRLLIEGPHLLETVLDLGLRVIEVFASERTIDRGDAVLRRLGHRPTLVADGLLDRLADADSPRGLLAIVEAPPWSLDALSRSSPDPSAPWVFADRIQDPGNLGAIARVMDAVGGAALVLGPGCALPSHPRALRASTGSLLRIPVAQRIPWQRLDQLLTDQKTRVSRSWLALTPRGGKDLYAEPLPGAIVLCLGAEGSGLDPELRRRCDLEITVPLAPGVESLNVTIAGALTLYEWRRRRSQSAS